MDIKTEAQLRQELTICWQLIEADKKDTLRFELLVKILQKHDLDRSKYGYTFFPKNAFTPPLVMNIYRNVRDLIDAVYDLKLEEYK